MTTRAGWIGMITGWIATILLYAVILIFSESFLFTQKEGFTATSLISVILLTILFYLGGFLAGRRSKSTQKSHSAVLGGLSGGLAGCLIFCFWGAATAGIANWIPDYFYFSSSPFFKIIVQTYGLFFFLFLDGIIFGFLGGWSARWKQPNHEDLYDKTDPQMAMNTSITALASSLLAAGLAAFFVRKSSEFLIGQTGQLNSVVKIINSPLYISLVFLLISHFILMKIIPHESRRADHLCGMREVRMTAWVGITAAPALLLLLAVIYPTVLKDPIVLSAAGICAFCSFQSLISLNKQVKPKISSFEGFKDNSSRIEALWFGSIAESKGSRLAVLCVGCGLVMVLPIYVSVISLLINIQSPPPALSATSPLIKVVWQVYKNQALFSMALLAGSILFLVLLYWFYLALGRSFNRRDSKK